MKDILRWLILVKFERLLKKTPALILHFLALFLGLLQYIFYKEARRIIRNNFAHQLSVGPLSREISVVRSFYQHLLNDLELVKYPEMDANFVRENIIFHGPGWEYLKTRKKRSAMLITFHFGAHQIIIPALPLLGYPFIQMGVPPSYWDKLVRRSPRLSELNMRRTQNLERTKASFIYVHSRIASVRNAFRAVNNGSILCIAGDGRIGKLQRYPFLSKGSIDFALGGIQIAMKHSLPIIPVVSRRKGLKFQVEMDGPFYVKDNGDDTDQAIRACIALLEKHTLAFPDQYGWMYYAKEVGG